jgi:hypothetical protein
MSADETTTNAPPQTPRTRRCGFISTANVPLLHNSGTACLVGIVVHSTNSFTCAAAPPPPHAQRGQSDTARAQPEPTRLSPCRKLSHSIRGKAGETSRALCACTQKLIKDRPVEGRGRSLRSHARLQHLPPNPTTYPPASFARHHL